MKLETLHAACACLLQRLGIRELVDEADVSPGSNTSGLGNESTKAWPLLPCSTQKTGLSYAESNTEKQVSLPHLMSVHRTGAEQRVHDYYDQETADLVTQVYAKDFVRFGYQVWKGPPERINLD